MVRHNNNCCERNKSIRNKLYELWISEGNTGTPTDFLEWLKSSGVVFEDTDSIAVSGEGSNDDPIKSDVKISLDEDNSLEVKPDGLYSPKVLEGPWVEVEDSPLSGIMLSSLKDYNTGVQQQPLSININANVDNSGPLPPYTLGAASFNLGTGNILKSSTSLAIGYDNISGEGNSICIIGWGNTVNTRRSSLVVGQNNHVNMAFSNPNFGIIVGYENVVTGYLSSALGNRNRSNHLAEFTIGTYSTGSEEPIPEYQDSPKDPVFKIGNGTDIAHRSDAFVVRREGSSVQSKTSTIKDIGEGVEMSSESLDSNTEEVTLGEEARISVTDSSTYNSLFEYPILYEDKARLVKTPKGVTYLDQIYKAIEEDDLEELEKVSHYLTMEDFVRITSSGISRGNFLSFLHDLEMLSSGLAPVVYPYHLGGAITPIDSVQDIIDAMSSKTNWSEISVGSQIVSDEKTAPSSRTFISGYCSYSDPDFSNIRLNFTMNLSQEHTPNLIADGHDETIGHFIVDFNFSSNLVSVLSFKQTPVI